MAGNSRSKRIVITPEAETLKRLRIASGLSLKDVAIHVGKNHSTIAHIENGRMAVPSGEYLESIVSAFGITTKTFREYVRTHGGKMSPEEQINELLKRMSPEKVNLVLTVARKIADGSAVVAV